MNPTNSSNRSEAKRDHSGSGVDHTLVDVAVGTGVLVEAETSAIRLEDDTLAWPHPAELACLVTRLADPDVDRLVKVVAEPDLGRVACGLGPQQVDLDRSS